MPKFLDLSGRRIGRWYIVARAPNGPNKQTKWTCRCECGTIRSVAAGNLVSGMTGSCGCRKVRHGRDGDPMVALWGAMIQRCSNPNHSAFSYYGGRGITVCEEWRASFATFISDMGVRPHGMTLERIDNNGPYCKANCKWATYSEQASNRRSTRFIEHDGKRLSVSQWAQLVGISRFTLKDRLNRGWPTEKALFTPPCHSQPSNIPTKDAV